MKTVAHFTPDDNPISYKWHRLFCPYVDDIKFIAQQVTADCDFIFCGSVSILKRVIEKIENDLFNKYDIPIYCWVWDLPVHMPERKYQIKQHLINLAKCERVFAASKFTQQTLFDLGIKAEQSYFYADIETLQMWDGAVKQYDVIQAGRMVPHKHFEDVLSATERKSLQVVFTGGHNDKCYVSRITEQSRNHTGEVFIKGRLSREDWVLTLRQSRLLVSASDFEGWGLSPVEALMCDVPVTVRDIPVFREVYENNILYFKTVPQLADNINLLLGDKILRQELLEGGKRCVQDFTPQKFAKRWEALCF